MEQIQARLKLCEGRCRLIHRLPHGIQHVLGLRRGPRRCRGVPLLNRADQREDLLQVG
jgi:hypothetical protein